MSRPIFKLKVFISQQRNLELLIWPESERDGKKYPPQPVLTEQRKKDDGEWESKTIYLTRAKIPELMAGLQIQYQNLLALEGNLQSSVHTAGSEASSPDSLLAGKLYKHIQAQGKTTAAELLQEFKVNADTLENALKALVDNRMIKTETKGFTVFVEVA